MLRRFCLTILAAMLFASSLRADDGEDVGEKLVGKPAPPLSFTAYNSHLHIDLAALRGKLVVIDFFECEKSTDSSGFDDLADLEHSKADKGVVVLGVSADMNPSAITTLLKKKTNIDWPIDYDPNGFSGKTCREWKESRKVGSNTYSSFFHLDYIIGTDGTVVWSGLPDQLDRAVTDQLKDHPPSIVDPATMNEATATLTKMQSALADKNLVEAEKQRHSISSAALADDDFAAKLKSADEQMKDADDAEMKSIDDLIANKQFPDASARLRALQSIDDGTSFAKSIRSRIVGLQRNPEVTAPKAKIALGHPASAPATKPSADSQKLRATGLLHLADSYRDNGNFEMAKDKYEAVAKEFPGSDEAATAQAELRKLPR